jgi:cell division protein FtsI/penicillin-binding protein 2
MKRKQEAKDNRLRNISLCFLILAIWLVAQLFRLQIVDHSYYALFASNAHEIYKKLHPERGQIFFQDTRTGQTYPAAINRQYYLLYAVPHEIPIENVASTTHRLADVLELKDESDIQEINRRLSKTQSYYQVIKKKVPEETMNKIKSEKIPGIYFTPQEFRYYPEEDLGAAILGFTSLDDNGVMTGKYGVEGNLNSRLSGKPGYVSGEKTRWGSWITFADRQVTPAENGVDVILTIDRTLQYQACKRLEEGRETYEAKSGSLVMMNPKTGAILAMCSTPGFNPNTYSSVKDVSSFNNTSIFNAYEPGSVFKPITMSVGIDLGLVGPQTTFTADPCKFFVKGLLKPIENADHICYPGANTMTYVLQKSINTGMTWLVDKIGLENFKSRVEKYGFGKKTGITLNTEVSGNISSLQRKVNMYYASFGQGVSVTPLQLAAAYSALSNDGKVPEPYIVDQVVYPDGKVEKTKPALSEPVISARTSKLITGMLVATVDSYPEVKLPHFYVAGKTGTAQIFKNNRLEEKDTNHTISGYAPAEDSKIVLVIRYEEPNKKWAGSTVGVVFKDIVKFALDYYGVPEQR